MRKIGGLLAGLLALDLHYPGKKRTRNGMEHLAGLSALQSLQISGHPACKKRALEPLAALTALRILCLAQVDLPSLCDLAPLENQRLERLTAYGSSAQLPQALKAPLQNGRNA